MENRDVKTVTGPVAVAANPTRPSLESAITDRAPQWIKPLQEPSIRLGLLLVVAMTALFGGYDYWQQRTGQQAAFTVFFVHYGVAAIYTLYLLIDGWLRFWFWKQTAAGMPQRMLALVLWALSCFALNRELAVFQASTTWLCYVLIVSLTLMTAVAWMGYLSVRLQQGLVLGLSAAWWLFVYQAIYIAPVYPLSVPGLLLLGMSVHSFIPLIIAATLGKWLVQNGRTHEHLRPAIRLGLALPVVILTVFLWQWQRLDTRVRYTLNAAQTRSDDDLPDWTRLAQRLNPGWLTDKWLYSGVVYDQNALWGGGMAFGGRLSEATQLHDPLVLIGSLLFPPLELANDDRAKLIAVLNDARHQTEEHLWTGRDLRVTNVTSQVRIYPDYRLAYTEKTLTIQNRNEHSGPQEAVFTAQLPEGSVVSSLSLWVNGREEKGVLTTQAKADTAYRTVVGVDSRRFARDPSVVRWLEGNRVSVRVFPCSPGQMRQVKIGITSPLRLEKNKLVYENPYFDGPDMRQATETVKLNFTQKPVDLTLPDFLKPSIFGPRMDKSIQHEGDYRSDWSVRLKAPALATAGFSLNGQTYTVAPAQAKTESFDPAAVYLDLNQSWTRTEFDAVLHAAGSRPVWVCDEALTRLTPDNRDALLDQLTEQRFSLFPIYRIPNSATALLITKSAAKGPQLDELADSPFARRLSRDASQRASLRTFSLSASAPLIQTLSELTVLNTMTGSTAELASLLMNKQFTATPTTNHTITIPQAGITIRSGSASPVTISSAPDQLVRLFAYNHLMSRVGSRYFTRNYLTDSLITEAEQANIVSPISGLIVLETQADYDRFGIKRDLNGLTNATLKNHGAVPEPHEWAMLLLLAGMVSWQRWKQFVGRADRCPL